MWFNYLFGRNSQPPPLIGGMPASDAQKIEELEKELQKVNAKNKDLEKQLRDLKDQQRANRRRRRNLPAELKVEIVDCLPLENAVHFLTNVPNRLIIHHCAPRVRRMLKMIDQIVIGYARTLPAPNSVGNIFLENGHKYTPEMDIFLRYGAAHCRAFGIFRDAIHGGFVGQPANFFDDIVKYFYETEILKTVLHLVIYLPPENPAPWPAALVETRAAEMDLEWKVNDFGKWVEYIMRNKHNPRILFKLLIFFQGGAKCYQTMSGFHMLRAKYEEEA